MGPPPRLTIRRVMTWVAGIALLLAAPGPVGYFLGGLLVSFVGTWMTARGVLGVVDRRFAGTRDVAGVQTLATVASSLALASWIVALGMASWTARLRAAAGEVGEATGWIALASLGTLAFAVGLVAVAMDVEPGRARLSRFAALLAAGATTPFSLGLGYAWLSPLAILSRS